MLRVLSVLVLAVAVMAPMQAQAFCGFFVSKAGADLFNKASKVVLARAEDRTVVTMASDFRGEMTEFAMVIPVPEVITEGQVNVTENSIIEHLDAYTAPRLVEYFDADPCQPMRMEMMMAKSASPMMDSMTSIGGASAQSLGVTIEAEYSVGEYDIVVLSAKQSDGLQTYLNQEGYKMPKGAPKILKSYIKQDMKFFLAKVNLEAQEKTGYTYLRPLQVAYEHKKFMLPIRLGTLNADGDQELILYTLTQKGRVEASNYRTVKIPTGVNIPLYTKDKFGEFYQAMFDKVVEKDPKSVFLEYAWDMGWCDPCAADPLPNKDLRTLGAWWVGQPMNGGGGIQPFNNRRIMPPQPQAAPVFVTRLHARYNAKTFPEDLILQETEDKQNFQGRYVLNHPWSKATSCEMGEKYFAELPKRFEKEAQNLANVTGWDIADIRKDMEVGGQSFKPEVPVTLPWWEQIWE